MGDGEWEKGLLSNFYGTCDCAYPLIVNSMFMFCSKFVCLPPLVLLTFTRVADFRHIIFRARNFCLTANQRKPDNARERQHV